MKWDEVVSTVHKVLKESQGNAPEPHSASGAERQTQRNETNQHTLMAENRENSQSSHVQGNSVQDRQDPSSESVGSLEMMCAMEGPSCSPPPLRRSTRKKRWEEQPGIRQPQIKRPPSAFILFKKEQRPKIMAELNISHNAAINAVLGQRWRALTPEEQASYRQHTEPQRSYSDNSGTKRKREESSSATASASESDREDQESKKACVSTPLRSAPMEDRCDTPIVVAPPPRDVPQVGEADLPRPSSAPTAEFTDMTPPPVPIPDEPLSLSALGITGELQLILENLENLENLASAAHTAETQTPFRLTCVKSVQTDMAEAGDFHARPESPPPSPPHPEGDVFRQPAVPQSRHAGPESPPPLLSPQPECNAPQPPPEPEGPTVPGEEHQEALPTDTSVSPPRTDYSPSQGIPEELQLLIEEIKLLSQKT